MQLEQESSIVVQSRKRLQESFFSFFARNVNHLQPSVSLHCWRHSSFEDDASIDMTFPWHCPCIKKIIKTICLEINNSFFYLLLLSAFQGSLLLPEQDLDAISIPFQINPIQTTITKFFKQLLFTLEATVVQFWVQNPRQYKLITVFITTKAIGFYGGWLLITLVDHF